MPKKEDDLDSSMVENDRLELALKASNEGIWDWKANEAEIYYSKRILEFLNTKPANAPNPFLPPHECVHPDERPCFLRALELTMRPDGPELFAIDCRLRAGIDHWPWMRIRGAVVRDQSGHVTRIAGSMIDISRRKKAEEQIKEDQHLLRMLIDHIPMQVYFKDEESRFSLANQKMAEWMGLDHPSELIGKHDRDFFKGEHAEQTGDDEKRILETGVPITSQLEQEDWDGTRETWVLTSKFPWKNTHGEIKGTFGVSSDVTDLVEARQSASNLADELSRRNELYEEEVQLAREIQQIQVQPDYPDVAARGKTLNFCSAYLPTSGLAGDFYKVIPLSSHKVGVLICDVMGHGVRSALVVAMLHGLLERQQKHQKGASDYLESLNDDLCSTLKRAETTIFATAFYGIIDLKRQTLSYATAGHPGALVADKDGVRQLCQDREDKGPGLGLVENAKFPCNQISTRDVYRLLLFTDGVIEAENQNNKEEFGLERLKHCIAHSAALPLDDLLKRILSEARQFTESDSFDDDVCLLAVGLERQ